MINRLIFLFILFLSVQAGSILAQHDIDFYADVMVSAQERNHRYDAAVKFENLLLQQLKADSTFAIVRSWKGAPVLYAPDSSFRIVSWYVPKVNSKSEGAIQIRGVFQKKGGAELQILSDKSEFERSNETSIFPPHRWLGAVYTEMYSVPDRDSLFLVYGRNPIDPYRMLHLLEVIDVRDSRIRFGHALWQNKDSTLSVRKIFEVARGAQFQPKLHPEAKRIVVDHLRAVPYDQKGSVMVQVPDGTYIFYDWEEEKWIYHDRLFSDDKDRVIRNPKKRKEASKRDLFGNPREK